MAVSRIVEEVMKFLLIACLTAAFYWTGQALFILITLGYYTPPDNPYGKGENPSVRFRRLFLSLSSVVVGVTFWLLTFPLLYDFFHQT